MFGLNPLFMSGSNFNLYYLAGVGTTSASNLKVHTLTVTNPQPGITGTFIVLGATGSTNAGTARTLDSIDIDGNSCTMQTTDPSSRATLRAGHVDGITLPASFDVVLTFSGTSSCAQTACIVLFTPRPITIVSENSTMSSATTASRTRSLTVTANPSSPQVALFFSICGNITSGSTVDAGWSVATPRGYVISDSTNDACFTCAFDKYVTSDGVISPVCTRNPPWSDSFQNMAAILLEQA